MKAQEPQIKQMMNRRKEEGQTRKHKNVSSSTEKKPK